MRTFIHKCNENAILRLIMESNRYDFEIDVSEHQDLFLSIFMNYVMKENLIIHKKYHLD